MGFFSFFKDAGQKLFGNKDAEAAAAKAAADQSNTDAQAALEGANRQAGDAIEQYITNQGLEVTGLMAKFDAASSTVDIFGVAADQETKEKVLLCCGNVAGVANVNDQMTTDQTADEAEYHDVVSGDTLSKIAKEYYGDAMKYPAIFEANKPMLSHPDKIYPGQKLRIPAEA
jgi:nucleoid-associated protein YgaU